MAGGLISPVSDDEIFFRRVLPGRNHYRREEGQWRVGSQAFSDAAMEPSVDRALLCSNDPTFTQQQPENAVLKIRAGDVRAVRFEHGVPARAFAADLYPDPLPENAAHYLVRLAPAADKGTIFKKLLERLAKKAEWSIEPSRE